MDKGLLNFPLYLAGYEVDFNKTEEARRFLETHVVDREGFEFLRKVNAALELKENIDGSITCFEHSVGRCVKKMADNICLPEVELKEHKLFFLMKSASGRHIIGGQKPTDLEFPHHPKLKTSFQYIGCIDGSDPYFQWIKTPMLHILFTMYECNNGIYLDWSEPNHPRVLNPDTFDPAWWIDGTEGYDVVFEATRYCSAPEVEQKAFENMGTPDNVLVCGVPIWIQYPEIPVCPKTNETMKFVCSVNSDKEIRVIPEKRDKNLPFAGEYLCFGDWGKLYVFYHPVSKIMHIGSQFG
jgi:hypothetical protein